MDNSQGSQCLDKVELASIEMPKFLVTLQQFFQLRRLFVAVAREKHPDILDSRTHASVVKVDDVQLLFLDQHIAGVKVSVNPQKTRGRRALETGFNVGKEVIRDTVIGSFQILRNKAVVQQVGMGSIAETVDIESRPFGK